MSPCRVPMLAVVFAGLVVLWGCAQQPTSADCPEPNGIDPSWLSIEGHGFQVQPLGTGLLVFGGYGRDRTGTTTEWIDLRTGARQKRADLAEPKSFHASVNVGGSIYAIGSTIERYDPLPDRWTTVLADPRIPRSHLSAGALGGDIHILGGVPDERSGFLRYDLETGELESLPTPADFEPGEHLSHVLAWDDALHFIGGLSGQSTQPMAIHRIWTGAAWKAAAPPPGPVEAKFGASGVIEGKAYIFSACGSYSFDPATHAWHALPPMPEIVAMPASIVIADRLYVIGGMRVEDGRGGTVHTYHARTGRWERRVEER